MATAAALCSSAFAEGLRPEPDLLVSEWAERHRIIGKPSPQPGPWNTERVPYARQIMDDLSPSRPAQIVALMKAAQGAGTEIGLNALGCWIDMYPDAALYVTPTTKTVRRFSTRIDRMVEATPRLRAKVSPKRNRSRSNTIDCKTYGVDELILTGANSAVDLRSNPARYGIGDEVDGYPFDLEGEGEPVDLFLQRLAAYENRKAFLVSTPTLELVSRIWFWFERGDQNLYEIPCPACGFFQPLLWGPRSVFWTGPPNVGGLKWPKGSPDLVRYECISCKERFEEWQKIEPLLAGQWIPRAPGHGGGVIRSYAINSLSYPFGWPGNAWPNLAEEWEVKHLDPTRLKTFVNLKLGEPWRDPEESRGDADSLMSRREAYGPEIPAAVGVLTAAVDVQANRLEAELCGWGKDEESWSIEYRVFPGNTTQPAVWEELDKWLQGSWLSENGLELSIRAVGVDAAYNTEAVRKFCASRSGRRVWPLQGKAGDRAAWPTKTPRQRGKYPPPFTIGVDTIKEIVYARLRIMDPGPGFCHFPSNYDRDYFDMLTAEVRVPDYTTPIPKYVWRKKSVSARNESLDLRVYNYAVLVGLTMTSSFRLNAEVAALERRAQQGPRVSAPSPNKPADEWLKGDRGKGWFS